MTDTPISLLVVDDDQEVTCCIRRMVAERGYRVVSTTSDPETLATTASEFFDVAVVNAAAASNKQLETIRQLKVRAPDTEVIVLSDGAERIPSGGSHDIPFVVVQGPCDTRLFATIEQALERRRMNLHNRRLMWELQTVNEIAGGISRSLELEDILAGALQRLAPALGAMGAAIRLRDDVSGTYETKASVGPPHVQQLWEERRPAVPRPSDQVIAHGVPVVVEDFAQLVLDDSGQALPVRSAISVPLIANSELLGTLSLGAAKPYRFDIADERLLAVIAGQIAVAVQNARLHDFVRRGKRDWEQTFDAIDDPIAVFDNRRSLLRGNKSLAAVLGRPVTAIRRVTCSEIGFCGGGCPACAVGRALTTGSAVSAEVTLPNGEIFSVTTFPVGGRVDGASVVQVAKNVTEEIRSARRLRQMSEELGLANERLKATLDQLKSMQAQLLQAEKLSAIGQLVAGVAHELNNPLTSVIGYAQLLEEELLNARHAETKRSAADLAHDLRRIAEESERAARIVRNLLAFARRQSAARAPQDVTELITRVLSLRAYDMRLNGIELRTEFQPGLPLVVADGSQLQQALLNLILNGEQAMRAQSVRRLAVGARFDEPTASVELYVSDTGHGIDHANLSRIFDPFFTTRDVGEGTGLGLSICYGIVRDHGGQIVVDSKVQVGTTFSLLLPARVAQMPENAAEILVAHPDQGERDFISAALTAWGYTVTSAGNADDALTRYRRGALQAVFIDRAVLAGDLTGWSAARNADSSVPLILMSMAADDGEVERFGREHASAVMAAPFQLRALCAAIRAVAKECV